MRDENMPLGRRPGARAPRNDRFSPAALSRLHHRRRDGRGRARQGHASVGVDDGDDLAGPVRRLVEVDVIRITGNASVDVGIGLGGRERNCGSNLLHGLDLVLEGRGVGRPAGKRGPVGRSRVDRVQLQETINTSSFRQEDKSPAGRGRGEDSGRADRQTRTSSSVSRLGQNSRSSSRSKERPASKRARKAVTAGASASSRMLFTPRNWRGAFWAAILGARRERPW